MKFELKRTVNYPANDCQFGEIYVDDQLVCLCLERLSKLIPVGIYPVSFYFSPHNQLLVPLLTVPSREYIEIHPANYPAQLEGCIAPCQTHTEDAGSNSRFAFEQLMNLIKDQDGLRLEVS